MFGIPSMLFWGAATSIPVLIHLFARQRYKRVPWAAMEFLLRAFKKTRRRIRLEHLLLLLLRILAILLFVLALADPLLSPGVVPGMQDSQREVVLLLDDSFSMGLKESDGGTPFARAREIARKLLSELQQERGDSVTLVLAGKPARLALKGVTDIDRALSTVDETEISDGATDYVGAFRATVAALDELQPGAEVFVLSDMQKIGLSPPAEGATTDDAADAPQQILSSLVSEMRARDAVISIIAPRETTTDNLAIVSLEKRSKVVVTGTAAVVTATLRNFGSRPQGGIVRLFVDGGSQPVEFRDVDVIPPGGFYSVDFRHTFRTPGSHFVEARFLSDNLETDNRRALVLEVRRKVKILIIDGDPNAEPSEAESFFFHAAMSPGSDAATDNEFDVEVVQEIVFERSNLKDVDLLVLMDVALISSRRADEIARFVEEGGGLLVFLGDKTQADTLNQRLWKSGSGVLPAKILGAAGEDPLTEIPYAITKPDLDHPSLRYFNDPAITPLLTVPPVYRYFRTQTKSDDPTVRVIAWLDRPKATLPSAEPFILEKSTGKGKTILIASSGGDPDWNEIHALPTYLMLTRELSYYLTRREERLENIAVGQSYQRILKSFAREVILSHDGAQISVLKPLALEGERGYELKTGVLEEAGLYRLDIQDGGSGKSTDPNPIHVAVNVDPAESDLTRADESYVTAAFPGGDVSWLKDIEEAEEASAAARDGRAWWWVMLLGAIVLALETALSQLFGLRSRATS